MTATLHHEPIKYQNTDFAIHRLIEDCPPHTVVRELLKNAEEAAVRLTPPGRVEWFIETAGDGVRKLGLFNEGPGMSAAELSDLMDMASTGKTLGTDENFGQGGKVSALRTSPAGVIYRSCKGGVVHQIVLMAEQVAGLTYPHYVKQRVLVERDGRTAYDHITDVTHLYEGHADRPLDRDWTEVVLVGRQKDQGTVANLLPEPGRRNWLIREINQRFYRFPEGVQIRNADISSGQQNARNAQGLEQLTLKWSQGGDARYEDVAATHPVYGQVTIRYCKLRGTAGGPAGDSAGNSRARTMEAYGIGTRGDHICMVWRDECYAVRTGWSQISGPFGVTFGSANIAIQILLPDDAPVRNNAYRDKLRRRDDGHHLALEEFAELVFQSRPQWLIQYVEEQRTRNSSGGNVMARLQQFLRELMVGGARRQVVEPGGSDEGERAGGGGGGGAAGGQGETGNHAPARGRRTDQQSTGIPRIEFTRDAGHLTEMNGRAAMYRRHENLVLLNPDHFRYLQLLESMYEMVGPDAERRAMAREIFDEEYQVQAGRFVIQALIFQGRPEWDDAQFEQALNIGSLTVVLASPNTLSEAQRRYNQRMLTNRVAAAGGN